MENNAVLCPNCGEPIDHLLSCGTVWRETPVRLDGDELVFDNDDCQETEEDDDYYRCPECGADFAESDVKAILSGTYAGQAK